MQSDRVRLSGAQLMRLVIVMLVVVGGGLSACAPQAQKGPLQSDPSHQLKTLAVDRQGLLRVNSVLLAPVQFQGNARLEGGDQERLDRELEFAAGRELDVDVTPPSKVKDLIRRGTAPDQFTAAAVDSAKKLRSDGVLVTTINTLEEREGSRVGADAPAALGFTMSLVRVADSRSVWSTSYYIQDHALSENLLSIHDTGWRSLQEHLTEGFSGALRELRRQRETAFGNGGR